MKVIAHLAVVLSTLLGMWHYNDGEVAKATYWVVFAVLAEMQTRS